MGRKMPTMNCTITQDLRDRIDRERDIQWARGRKISNSEVVRYILDKGLKRLEWQRTAVSQRRP